jgi:hypothetical protein
MDGHVAEDLPLESQELDHERPTETLVHRSSGRLSGIRGFECDTFSPRWRSPARSLLRLPKPRVSPSNS